MDLESIFEFKYPEFQEVKNDYNHMNAINESQIFREYGKNRRNNLSNQEPSNTNAKIMTKGIEDTEQSCAQKNEMKTTENLIDDLEEYFKDSDSDERNQQEQPQHINPIYRSLDIIQDHQDIASTNTTTNSNKNNDDCTAIINGTNHQDQQKNKELNHSQQKQQQEQHKQNSTKILNHSKHTKHLMKESSKTKNKNKKKKNNTIEDYNNHNKESCNHVNNQIISTGKEDDCLKQKLEESKNKFWKVIINQDETEEIKCSICLDTETFEGDDILLCDLCNAGCHQSCYGSEIRLHVPEEQWFCQRCSQLMNNNIDYDDIKCSFCPELKGIIKRTKNPKFPWAHVVCVNWIPELYYIDSNLVENVYLEKYVPERKKLLCIFCKIPYGDCIQCDVKECMQAFHVTCGQRKGLIRNYYQMEENLIEG